MPRLRHRVPRALSGAVLLLEVCAVLGLYWAGVQPRHTTTPPGQFFGFPRPPSDWVLANDPRRSAERRVAAHPRDASAWRELGTVLGDDGSHGEAAAAYRRATQLDPRGVENWIGLGEELGAHGEHRAAARALKRALALDPDNGSAWYLLAGDLEQQGRLGQAVDAYRRCVRAQPNSEACWRAFGRTLEQCGRHREADEAFSRAARLRHEPPAPAGAKARGEVI